MDGAAPSSDRKVWELPAENELRIESGPAPGIQLRLLSGTAELFGTELVPEKLYTFVARNFAIFSWHGAEIEIERAPKVAYVSDETPMVVVANMHAALETLRAAAEAAGPLLSPAAESAASSSSSNASPTPDSAASSSSTAETRDWTKFGPRVLIVGSTDAGKSTLARTLANYAVRAQRAPLLVDLDCGQNELAPPGCVAACQLLHPADVEHEAGAFTSPHLGHAPIAYFFGHTTPSANDELYRRMCDQLARVTFRKMEVLGF